MAIAGAHPGGVRQADLLAITAGPARPDHLAVGGSNDRSAIMGAESMPRCIRAKCKIGWKRTPKPDVIGAATGQAIVATC